MRVQYLGSLDVSSGWAGKLPAESRGQKAAPEVLPGRGARLRSSLRREGAGKLHPPGAAQCPDCVLGPDVLLRAVAQKGFSAACQWQICAIPAGKVLPWPSPDPRRLGSCWLRGAGAEGCSVCPDTCRLSRPPWKCHRELGWPARGLRGRGQWSWGRGGWKGPEALRGWPLVAAAGPKGIRWAGHSVFVLRTQLASCWVLGGREPRRRRYSGASLSLQCTPTPFLQREEKLQQLRRGDSEWRGGRNVWHRLGRPCPRLPREEGDAQSLEPFQTRLCGALSNLL